MGSDSRCNGAGNGVTCFPSYCIIHCSLYCIVNGMLGISPASDGRCDGVGQSTAGIYSITASVSDRRLRSSLL